MNKILTNLEKKWKYKRKSTIIMMDYVNGNRISNLVPFPLSLVTLILPL